jgi:uncharacterized protein YcbX
MSIVGKVESLWRYPVKSLRGESPTDPNSTGPLETAHEQKQLSADKSNRRAITGPR